MACGNRCHVDDGSVGRHVRDGTGCHEQGTLYVDIHHTVDEGGVQLRHAPAADESARVVHKDVDLRTEQLPRLLQKLFYARLRAHVRLNGFRRAALFANLPHGRRRLAFALVEVHDDACATLAECPANGTADVAPAAGDNGGSFGKADLDGRGAMR